MTLFLTTVIPKQLSYNDYSQNQSKNEIQLIKNTLGLSLMVSLKNPEVVMKSVVLVVTADTNDSMATILDDLCLLAILYQVNNHMSS